MIKLRAFIDAIQAYDNFQQFIFVGGVLLTILLLRLFLILALNRRVAGDLTKKQAFQYTVNWGTFYSVIYNDPRE